MKTQLYLTPQQHGDPLTWDEFAHAEHQEGFRYELIQGRLFVSPVPNLPHDALKKDLERLLDAYAEKQPNVINRVHAPTRVFLPNADEHDVTAPEPDIAAYANYPVNLPRTQLNWRNVSPVLVVEVISEDTADKDLTRNRRLYLSVPTIQEYWIVEVATGLQPGKVKFKTGH